MEEEKFAELCDELMAKIGDGPDSHMHALSKIAEKDMELLEIQKTLASLKKTMAAIRLILKYLLFDLEATKRERDQLRMRLEDRDD